MRTTRILATVAAVILIGSAPASSLNVPRPQARTCSPVKVSAISLVGSQGVFGFVLIPPNSCSE
jgi:hypothetical protein